MIQTNPKTRIFQTSSQARLFLDPFGPLLLQTSDSSLLEPMKHHQTTRGGLLGPASRAGRGCGGVRVPERYGRPGAAAIGTHGPQGRPRGHRENPGAQGWQGPRGRGHGGHRGAQGPQGAQQRHSSCAFFSKHGSCAFFRG